MNKAKLEKLISLLFTTRQIVRDQTPEAERVDAFSMLRMETLRFIADNKPSMKELADYLHITAPSTTVLAQSLSKCKYIKREKDLTDKRTTHLVITPMGRSMIKKNLKLSYKHFEKIFSCLSEKQLDNFISIFEEVQAVYNSQLKKS